MPRAFFEFSWQCSLLVTFVIFSPFRTKKSPSLVFQLQVCTLSNVNCTLSRSVSTDINDDQRFRSKVLLLPSHPLFHPFVGRNQESSNTMQSRRKKTLPTSVHACSVQLSELFSPFYRQAGFKARSPFVDVPTWRSSPSRARLAHCCVPLSARVMCMCAIKRESAWWRGKIDGKESASERAS